MHGYCKSLLTAWVSDCLAPPIRQDGAQLLQLVADHIRLVIDPLVGLGILSC